MADHWRHDPVGPILALVHCQVHAAATAADQLHPWAVDQAVQPSNPRCIDQGRSQLKTNPGAPSIKYKGICTILKEIHGNFEVHISNFSFYRGARAPGKANVASPLASML